MDKDVVPGRAGAELSAETTIRTLTQQLNDLKVASGNWIINFEVDVLTTDGERSIVITGRTAERGIRQTLTQEEILYASSDVDVFIKRIADKFATEILSQTANEALAPKLKKAINSVVAISRGGFSA